MFPLSHLWRAVMMCYSQLKTTLLRDTPRSSDRPETSIRSPSLIEYSAFYCQLFEQSQAAQLIIDPETGHIITANPAAGALYGYPLEQFKLLRVTGLNTQSWAELQADMQTTAEKPVPFEVQHRLASGVLRDVQIFSNSLEFNTKHYLHWIIQDITDRKQAEATLRVSETRFRSLVDSAPVGILYTDTTGKRVFCNRHWCDLTGLSLEEALRFDDQRVIYPDDREIANTTWKTLLKTHLPFDDVIFRYQRPDATPIWVSSSGRPLLNAQGAIIGYLGVVTDITERKQFEDALTFSELHFQTLVDFAPVGIVETNADGQIMLANAAWHTLSGIDAADVFTDNAAGTIHPDDLPHVQAVHQASVETRDAVDNLEYRYVHPDGKVIWVSDSSRALLNASGTATGYIVTMTDITERKRLEDELRHSEQRLRLITDNVQDLITQNDMQGLLQYVSPSSRTLLGYEPESLLNSYSLNIVHPDDRPAMTHRFQMALETGDQSVILEGRLLHSDGHYIWTESVVKFLFDAQSQLIGSIFICRDITQRRHLQTLVLEKERLEGALQKEQELSILKTRMMERITHEFRTPLTILQASSETLTHYLERLSPEQRVTKVNTIQATIQRITDMLDEIGLVINGSFTPDHIHRFLTDLSARCRGIAVELEAQLNLPGKYELHLPETTFVLVDPTVLRNALLHILRNAARFSEPSTKVTVSLSRLENGIQIQVTNTGMGILPQEQSRIFEPFFRGSNIGELSGLGVGLTIARAAIEAHGGTIKVDSVPLQDTVFTLWIPT